MGLQELAGVGGGCAEEGRGGRWFQFSRDVVCEIFICGRKSGGEIFHSNKMCHVSFNLVGIHRPAADRLPSLLARKEGDWA